MTVEFSQQEVDHGDESSLERVVNYVGIPVIEVRVMAHLEDNQRSLDSYN